MTQTVREFACQWYYNKYQETGRLIMSPWTRRLLVIHGSEKKVAEWLKGEMEAER